MHRLLTHILSSLSVTVYSSCFHGKVFEAHARENDFFHCTATKESVDIEELVDDFVLFYVAGQESTAHLLTFALILILQHPHVLERYMCTYNTKL